ncbi:uncharacterized protein LOC144908700 [Branchiostoma floridae x Branchiostoma belcheri]|nr:hypothetical protein Bbelb_118840 [Branchiostoma belcheri]
MKSLVVFVVSLLAVALAQTPNPPNFAVKEENGKCLWSIATDKPTGGCTKTNQPGPLMKDIKTATAGETARQAKMTSQIPLDKAVIQNRITMTEVARLTLESQVTVMESQLNALEKENKALNLRLNGDPADPKKIGIAKAIQNYGLLVDKLATATDTLLKKP